MKYFITITFLLCNYINAQTVGDTRSTVLELEGSNPCDETRPNMLLFCSGQNKTIYTFNSKNYCGQITKLTAVTREQAEIMLANKLSLWSVKPYVSGNRYIFFINEATMVTYSIQFLGEQSLYFSEMRLNTVLLEE